MSFINIYLIPLCQKHGNSSFCYICWYKKKQLLFKTALPNQLVFYIEMIYEKLFIMFLISHQTWGNMFDSCFRLAGCICIRFSQKSNIFCPFRPQISPQRTIYHGWYQLSDTSSVFWASSLYLLKRQKYCSTHFKSYIFKNVKLSNSSVQNVNIQISN